MKVSELIAKLKEYPDDLEVFGNDGEYGIDILTKVEMEKVLWDWDKDPSLWNGPHELLRNELDYAGKNPELKKRIDACKQVDAVIIY